MLSTSRPLYFWHIPKTAGTSFIEWLDQQFAPEDVFAPQLLPQLRAASDDDVRGRRLYRGHLAGELPTRVGEPVDAITLLREPRARTISHLGHIWHHQTHPLHDRIRAVGPDLTTVLSDGVLRRTVTDVQSRYLALPPSRTTDEPLPIPIPEQLRDQLRFELAPLPGHRALAGRAVVRLLQMADFGLSSQLDAFTQRLVTVRGWRATAVPRSNVTPPTASPWRLEDLGEAEWHALDVVNRADRVLFRVASALTPGLGGWRSARALRVASRHVDSADHVTVPRAP